MLLLERRWCNSNSAPTAPTLPPPHGEPQAPGGGGPASSFLFLKLERPPQSPAGTGGLRTSVGPGGRPALPVCSSRFSAPRGRETAGKQVTLPAPEPERTRRRDYGCQLWTQWDCLLSTTQAFRQHLRESTHPGPQAHRERQPASKGLSTGSTVIQNKQNTHPGRQGYGRCRRQLEF